MASSPINITNNYDNSCELKCDYKYKYSLSNLTLTNKGQYAYMTVDNNTPGQVVYNSENYQVREIRLYRNSLHTYAGNHAECELIIVHTSLTGDTLLVCIPIIPGTGSGNNEGKSILDSIISEMSKTANSVGQQTVITLPTFTLDKLIPHSPFFSYSGTLPYSPSNGDNDLIVFNRDYALNISQKALDTFSQMVSASAMPIKSVNSSGLFYNKKGPMHISSGGNGDGIYIECLPTGDSGEVLVNNKEVTSDSLFGTGEMQKILKSPLILSLFGVFVVIGVIYGGKMVLNTISQQSGGMQSGGAVQSGGMQSGGMQSGGMQSGAISKRLGRFGKK